MDDDDPLLMSLADALTCSFGAALALFLIFVVLVRFAPPSPIVTSGAQDTNSLTRSLAAEEPGDSSLVIQGYSRHDGFDFDCERSAVSTLAIKNAGETRTWQAEHLSFSGNAYVTNCVVTIEAPQGIEAGQTPEVGISKGHQEEIGLQIYVGAVKWPRDTPAFFNIPDTLRRGTCVLVRITGRLDKPVDRLEC